MNIFSGSSPKGIWIVNDSSPRGLLAITFDFPFSILFYITDRSKAILLQWLLLFYVMVLNF